ncbi:MAG: hypothetical protein JNJ71_15255 [Rubrivivax sp.]|nr:hypothetical protein [Rubrivivax sp.]
MTPIRPAIALLLSAVSAGCVAGSPGQAASTPKAADCSPAATGGAAPPRILSDEHLKALGRVLKGHVPDKLDAAGAAAIRKGLCEAGIPEGPALNEALARQGFSARRLAELAPTPAPQASPAASAPLTPSGRRVPPPQ